ncbi:MAG: DUF296 domain-containing protein [Polyangia bacterium]|nr:DUF296 domain-containing protein [Polyangia bacterium]
MLTVESHQGRTIVGRLERGEDLLEGIRAVCTAHQVRGGLVTAIGALETVEVTHYLPGIRAYGPRRTLSGPLEILSLTGNLSESDGELSIHVHVTLSREGDNGIELFGGHLTSGLVFACEFCIVALDDVLLRRAPDPDTGLRIWSTGFEQGPDGSGRVVEPTRHTTGASPKGQSPGALGHDSPDASDGVPGDALDGSTPSAQAASVQQHGSEPGQPRAEVDETGAGGSAPMNEEARLHPQGIARPHRPPRAAAPIAWEDVAIASAAAQREPAELPIRPDREARAAEDPAAEEDLESDGGGDDYVDLEPGDLIEHPRFGRCRVERVEGKDEFVHVRLRNRNLVRLSLDVITLELIGSEGGHQVFRARIG